MSVYIQTTFVPGGAPDEQGVHIGNLEDFYRRMRDVKFAKSWGIFWDEKEAAFTFGPAQHHTYPMISVETMFKHCDEGLEKTEFYILGGKVGESPIRWTLRAKAAVNIASTADATLADLPPL